MLVGRLLFVEWPEVVKTAVICAAVGLMHFVLRRRYFSISASVEEARRSGSLSRVRCRWREYCWFSVTSSFLPCAR